MSKIIGIDYGENEDITTIVKGRRLKNGIIKIKSIETKKNKK